MHFIRPFHLSVEYFQHGSASTSGVLCSCSQVLYIAGALYNCARYFYTIHANIFLYVTEMRSMRYCCKIESYHLDTGAVVFHHDFKAWKLCIRVVENKSRADEGVCVQSFLVVLCVFVCVY